MSGYKFLTLCVFCLLHAPGVLAQHDTTYYNVYDDKITGRFYFSQKYTIITVHDEKNKIDLSYRPNTTLNMGVGATYRWATLNLAYGFGFLNPERGQGKTQYLDLQFHNYGRKVVYDAFGQFYKGFFLGPKGLGRTDGQYYLRPDLFIYELGLNAQYVFNHKRFSHKAGSHQSEWQKKSAGSFLLGAEVYWGHINGDSSIVPTNVNKEAAAREIKQLYFWQLGPNLGYAYTLVIKRHFFVTGSLTVSYDYGENTSFDQNGSYHESGFTPNTFIRIFTGYNSDVWALSIVYVNDTVNLATGGSATRATVNTGNIRVNLVRRFPIKKKLQKMLDIIDL